MTSTCPDLQSWQSLLQGTLSEAQQVELNAHLESCTACQQTLEGLVASQESWRGTAEELHRAPFDPTGKLGQVMADLKARAAQGETKADSAGGHVLDLSFLQPSQVSGHLGRLKHYEVLEVLGKGAFGTVFKAHDETLDRVVAIKVLAPQLATNATARGRFKREAKAAAAVSHDHVVGIHAVEETDAGVPYIVMQLISGRTLQERLDESGPLELKEILRIGMQTAEGLAAAERQGLVHRDIKPANILLENGVERVKITDFGLARAIDDASLTQSGVIAGTPMFMAPEQAAGEAIDHRADLFSLGSVLYTMCTGRPPFRASGTMAVMKRVIEEAPTPIREINPEIPEWLCDIIAKLQAKKPADRCQTAKEMADLLGQHLAHLQQPSLVPQPASVEVPASAATPSLRPIVITPAVFIGCVIALGMLVHAGITFSHWENGELSKHWILDLGLGLSIYASLGLWVYRRLRSHWRHASHHQIRAEVPPLPRLAPTEPPAAAKAWKIGDRVFAPWEGDEGWSYAARIHEIKGDAVLVWFDDGEVAWVKAEELRPLELGAGSRVLCAWDQGYTYYPGNVTQREGDRVHVAYDDGDEEWTLLQYVCVPSGKPTSAAQPKGRKAAPMDSAPARELHPALARLRIPASGLIITGVLYWVTIPFLFFIRVAGPFENEPFARMPPIDDTTFSFLWVRLAILPAIAGFMLIFAGSKMRHGEFYWLCVLAASLPFALLMEKMITLQQSRFALALGDWTALPFGMWALIALSRRDVRSAFAAQRIASPESFPDSPPANNFGRELGRALLLASALLFACGFLTYMEHSGPQGRRITIGAFDPWLIFDSTLPRRGFEVNVVSWSAASGALSLLLFIAWRRSRRLAAGDARLERHSWLKTAAFVIGPVLLVGIAAAPILLFVNWERSEQRVPARIVFGIAGLWESDLGPVTLQHEPLDGEKPVAVSGSFILNGVVTELLKRGTFDPVARTLDYSFDGPGPGVTGTTMLKLSADGNKLEGTWRNNVGDSGVWTMTRKPVAPAADSARLAELQRLISLQQKNVELGERRFEAGMVTSDEVTVAEIDLLEAKIRLAEAEKKPADVKELGKQLVRRYEDRVAFAKIVFEEGKIAEDEVNKIERQLTQVRIRFPTPAPETDRPKKSPVGRVLRFDPAKDITITKDGVSVEQGMWKIVPPTNASQWTRMFELRDMAVENCRVTLRGQMKTEAMKDYTPIEAAFCLAVDAPVLSQLNPKRLTFTFGTSDPKAVGNTAWAPYAVTARFLGRPSVIAVNIATTYAYGAVWVKDLELAIEALPAAERVPEEKLAPPPLGPAKSVRRFAPPKDSFITLDYMTPTKNGWKIDYPMYHRQDHRLFELRDHGLGPGTLILKMRVKTDMTPGFYINTAYPFVEFRPPVLSEGKKAIPWASPGFKAQQNTNWAWYEARVRCEEAPGVIALGFTFDGVGTAWMEDLELLYVPMVKDKQN